MSGRGQGGAGQVVIASKGVPLSVFDIFFACFAVVDVLIAKGKDGLMQYPFCFLGVMEYWMSIL